MPVFDRSAAKIERSNAQLPEFVPGEILVRYRTETEAKVKESRVESVSILGKQMTVQVESFDGGKLITGLRIARVAPENTLEAVAALNQEPDVVYAEPNYIMRKRTMPNDPLFADMWGLRNTGQTIGSPTPVSGADIKAEQAWNITTGSSSVVVGVIDTGIDVNHEDLKDNIWTNPGETPGNGVDDDNNGKIDDVNGWDFYCATTQNCPGNNTVFDSPTIDDHGTHVAGTIGARGNNGIGVTGINWQVKIMSLKFLGSASGSGATSGAISAINYAISMKNRGVNLRVLNNSWGGGADSDFLRQAIQAAEGAGILFVAAAGNEGTENDDIPHYPSNYNLPNIVSVANTDGGDERWGSSGFGKRTSHIGAPGRNILSTIPAPANQPSNKYAYFTGTSMAAPHVSGVAALIVAAYPNISMARLRAALIYSGDVIPSMSGVVSTGRRLNALKALENAAVNDTTPPKVGGLTIVSQVGRTVTAQFTAGDDELSGTAAAYDVRFFPTAPNAGGDILLASNAATPGGVQTVTLNMPVRYTSGMFIVRAFDEAGNNSANEYLDVIIPADASEPYNMTLSDHSALSTGGMQLDFGNSADADDKLYRGYALPFAFPFFGVNRSAVTVSTNGVLYFAPHLVKAGSTDALDPQSSTAGLSNQLMIAGLWEDIDLRPCFRADSGVFVTNTGNGLIFRWQGVRWTTNTCPGAPTGNNHINFEIELRNDGTIIKRYGEGNQGLDSVVGISAGETDTLSGGVKNAYIATSYTSANPSDLKTLTNAQNITYSVRPFIPPAPTPLPTPTPTPPTSNIIQLSQAAYSFNEGNTNSPFGFGSLNVEVTRTDPRFTAAVRYSTSDTSGGNECNQVTGQASQRCDYGLVNGTLRFAPGEASKAIVIPIVSDGYVEGNETFTIKLLSTDGATLGTSQATITIVDRGVATPAAQNPYLNNEFFVRQNYMDFLFREPDAEGWATWPGVLNNCDPGDGFLGAPLNCDRAHVAHGFIASREFTDKGYLGYRMYEAAFSRLPRYSEFVPDMAAMTGAPDSQELEQNTQQFVENFTQRQEFINKYADVLAIHQAEQFIARLEQNAGVTLPATATTLPGQPRQYGRQELINKRLFELYTMGQILRAFVEQKVVYDKYFERGFVTMQYFGFLRRDPDLNDPSMLGWKEWVFVFTNGGAQRGRPDILPRDYHHLTFGFIYSEEYRRRFGQP